MRKFYDMEIETSGGGIKLFHVQSGDLLHLNDRLAKRSYTYLVNIEKNAVGQPTIVAQQIDSPNNVIEVNFYKKAT